MSAKKTKLENTGERMIPAFHKGGLTYAEHILRYEAAKSFVKGKTVLDIASGSGYGTHLLAEEAKHVYGVDVDAKTVEYAKENYQASNIDFLLGNGEHIPLDTKSVDVVITFETIEHIKDYQKFLKEVSRVLKPNGVAIVSTPNDLEFAEGNHYHLHEFEYQELYNLLEKHFKYIDSYYQGIWKYVALGPEAIFGKEGASDIKNVNLAPLDPKEYLYFYLVCSNAAIEQQIAATGAMGGHYSDRQLQKAEQDVAQEMQKTIDHLNELQKSHDSLFSKSALLEAELEKTTEELIAIKNSRAYRAAVNMRTLKAKLQVKKPS